MLKSILKLFIIVNLVINSENLRRERTLIYPPAVPTWAQFIYGFGIPLEGSLESVTSGWVVKINYVLPTNITNLNPLNFMPQPVARENAVQNLTLNDNLLLTSEDQAPPKYIFSEKLLKYRWAFYKCLEAVIERMGYPGKNCMLRSICEAAETSFHYHSGILGELVHIVMTPSTSLDDMNYKPRKKYFYAEKVGKSGAPCEKIFHECKESILAKFSEIIFG